MYCLKMSTLSWEYEAAMRIMDNSPHLPATEIVEIGIRVIETRKAVSDHSKNCIFCNGTEINTHLQPSLG
jgi:hypothetical protein